MTPAARIFKEKRALVWPIVLALVANVALFLLVVYPLARKVDAGQRDAEASAAALAAARRSHAAARATVAGKGQADEELQQFYGDVLPPDLSGARGLTFVRLDQLAKKTGLRLRDQRATATSDRESALAKLTITVSLSGEYRDIRAFIHELESAPEFLVLENVDLSQGADEDRGIDVSVQIATYFRAGGHGDN